jgi:polar amino acid transport system substrate-binding protein
LFNSTTPIWCRLALQSSAPPTSLNRIVKRAELVFVELPDLAFDPLRTGNVDAFALPREPLLDYSIKLPGSCVLPDSYGFNRVAMAVPKGQPERLACITEFVEEAKASGLIQRIIEHGALHGFEVASAYKAE